MSLFSEIQVETFEAFKKFKALVEKQREESIKILRTDRGGEFLSNSFIQFCEEQGLHRELTAPYTPEQNGIAERKNRTVVEMARSLLKEKELPNKYWAEAVATSVCLLNLSPTKAVLNQTPYEAWSGEKPSVSHLKIFGCIAYALIDSHNRSKLDDKSTKCIFVGYCTQSKAYRLYEPVKGKVIISRNVIFDEEANWKWQEESGCVQTNVQSLIDAPTVEETSLQFNLSSPNPSNSVTSSCSSSSLEETPPRKFRSLSEIYNSTQALFVADPTNFEEAV